MLKGNSAEKWKFFHELFTPSLNFQHNSPLNRCKTSTYLVGSVNQILGCILYFHAVCVVITLLSWLTWLISWCDYYSTSNWPQYPSNKYKSHTFGDRVISCRSIEDRSVLLPETAKRACLLCCRLTLVTGALLMTPISLCWWLKNRLKIEHRPFIPHTKPEECYNPHEIKTGTYCGKSSLLNIYPYLKWTHRHKILSLSISQINDNSITSGWLMRSHCSLSESGSHRISLIEICVTQTSIIVVITPRWEDGCYHLCCL